MGLQQEINEKRNVAEKEITKLVFSEITAIDKIINTFENVTGRCVCTISLRRVEVTEVGDAIRHSMFTSAEIDD